MSSSMINVDTDEMTEIHLVVLLGIRDRKSFRELARETGKSLGTIQIRMRDLERNGYVNKQTEVKARARSLTKKGKMFLKSQGYESDS